jgi:hypothetical protein
LGLRGSHRKRDRASNQCPHCASTKYTESSASHASYVHFSPL